jgi:hypothetical protein
MGRRGPSKARPPTQRSRRHDDENLGMQPEDFVDEIDEFHNKREKISLDPTKDLGELRGSGNPFPDLETLANEWQFIRT